ncbi:hypothetical protein EV426DRAFT_639838 [Tirmania nivea]|nr:hypothetical protein EV426DRAFT_639838 [Tirmania nivea]
MESFFSHYPTFNYNPQEPPISEFMRLRASTLSWNKIPAPSYLEARKSFLVTWKEINNTVPIDAIWEFFSQFPEIVNDPREEGFDPETEFKRLVVLRQWRVTSRRYRRMKRELHQALGLTTEASGSRSHSLTNRETATGVSSPLSVFFSKYTDFDYDPTKLDAAPVSEFERLASLRKWRRTGKYVKKRKEFDIVLKMAQGLPQEESNQKHIPLFKDPVTVFFSQFSDFHYDPTKEGATPRSEFDRMTKLKGWIMGTKDYRLREKQFQHAEELVKQGRGHDHMSFFFAPWTTFNYTPTVDARTASLEFNRLSIFIGWGCRKECQRRTEFENALRFLYEDGAFQQGGGLETSFATVQSIREGLSRVNFSPEGAAGSRSIASPSFTPSNGGGPLHKFFAAYLDFSYNPAAPCRIEFQRLCTLRGWQPGKRRFRKAWVAFARAAGEDLLSHLGQNGTMFPMPSGLGETGSDDDDEGTGTQDDSTPWRRICRILNLRTADGLRPESKTQCKKALNRVFINIFDFYDHLSYGEELRRFPNLTSLSEYSYDEDKIYPKAAAKESELLKFLMRQIGSRSG